LQDSPAPTGGFWEGTMAAPKTKRPVTKPARKNYRFSPDTIKLLSRIQEKTGMTQTESIEKAIESYSRKKFPQNT
jgi:hypothetical protein